MLALCVGTGLAIRFLHRLPRLIFAATLIGSAAIGGLLATTFESYDLVGRTLTLDGMSRAFLWLALGTTAALALFGPLTSVRGGQQPATVISNALGAFLFWSLAALIVAIALDSFPLAVFFWALGLIALVFLTRSHRTNRAGGASQFLLLTVVATASLLLANRLIELYPLTPENLDLARAAALFLVIGLGILLAAVPLNLWLGTLADEMPLLGVAFLVGVAQPVGLWLLIQLATRVPWLIEKTPLLAVLYSAGALSALGGAFLVLAERRDNRFVAAFALLALGDALIGLGLWTPIALIGALLVVINRALGVTLMSGGLSLARHHPERRWQTVGILAILAGGWALAGLPPSLGAVARWSIYRDLENPALLLALVGASVAGLFALLRFTLPLISANAIGTEEKTETKILPYLGAAVISILIGVVVTTGLFPNLVVDPLQAALSASDLFR